VAAVARRQSAVKPKFPVSVLVVVHTPTLEVLLLERAAYPGYWQSVTGSLEHPDEALEAAALREVGEETGLQAQAESLRRLQLTYTYEIFPEWRHRFAPGTTHNVEHVFGLQVPAPFGPVLAPREHRAACWLDWRNAVARCFSWSNRDAIHLLAERLDDRR